MRRSLDAALVVAVLLGLARSAAADDVFHVVPAAKLPLIEGTLPEPPREPEWPWSGASQWRRDAMEPCVLLEGDGEAYLEAGSWLGNLTLRLPQPRTVSGRLLVPNGNYSGLVALPFKLAPQAADPSARKRFYWAKESYYNRLAAHGLPGTAWFRRQARLAREALPVDQRVSEAVSPDTARLDRTFSLFSGSRAISENLQLDRGLPAARNRLADDATVDVASLQGISVAAIDWKPRIANLHPKLDPLAALVPADQHALFFASFEALLHTSGEVESQGAPVALLIDTGAEIGQVKARYERQLGLSLSALAHLLGPQLVRSVAVTGSDPYFVTGTDLAVLFEADRPDVLKTLLLAQAAARTQGEPRVAAVEGEAAGVKYAGFRSPDRHVSSYVAVLGEAVVVTNSPAQLARLAAVEAGRAAPLASLDEYTFFRDRYRRGDKNEAAFLFLSDATIRRWCAPRWRIADSRRTRALAWLNELAAAQLDGLAQNRPAPPAGAAHAEGEAPSAPEPVFWRFQFQNGHWWYWLPSRQWVYWDGSAWRDYDRKSYAAWYRKEGGQPVVPDIDLSAYGMLEFLTPIIELPLERVSEAEAAAYRRWRDGYQRNWSWAFDPIGLQLGIDEHRLTADLTVMPLIASSEYRWIADQSRGAKLTANPDPHPMVAQFAAALNGKGFLGGLGRSMALVFDNDEFWGELAAQTSTEAASRLVWEHLDRVPVGLFIGGATRQGSEKMAPDEPQRGFLQHCSAKPNSRR